MRRKPEKSLRGNLNLTIHPEIRDFAQILATKRRRSISQLFEDLVEAEWVRRQGGQIGYIPPASESLKQQYGNPVVITQQVPQDYAPTPVQY